MVPGQAVLLGMAGDRQTSCTNVVVPAVEPKHAAKCCPDNLHDLTMDVFGDSRMNQFQSGLTARDTGTCVHS